MGMGVRAAQALAPAGGGAAAARRQAPPRPSSRANRPARRCGCCCGSLASSSTSISWNCGGIGVARAQRCGCQSTCLLWGVQPCYDTSKLKCRRCKHARRTSSLPEEPQRCRCPSRLPIGAYMPRELPIASVQRACATPHQRRHAAVHSACRRPMGPAFQSTAGCIAAADFPPTYCRVRCMASTEGLQAARWRSEIRWAAAAAAAAHQRQAKHPRACAATRCSAGRLDLMILRQQGLLYTSPMSIIVAGDSAGGLSCATTTTQRQHGKGASVRANPDTALRRIDMHCTRLIVSSLRLSSIPGPACWGSGPRLLRAPPQALGRWAAELHENKWRCASSWRSWCAAPLSPPPAPPACPGRPRRLASPASMGPFPAPATTRLQRCRPPLTPAVTGEQRSRARRGSGSCLCFPALPPLPPCGRARGLLAPAA